MASRSAFVVNCLFITKRNWKILLECLNREEASQVPLHSERSTLTHITAQRPWHNTGAYFPPDAKKTPGVQYHPNRMNRELPTVTINLNTPCFFVLCNRHWFNRVSGANLETVCLPFTFTLTQAAPTYPYNVTVTYWRTPTKHEIERLGIADSNRILHLLLFITAVPNIKLFARGEQDSGGHVL